MSTTVHADPWLTIHGGDCRDVLPTLPADSVHCVVTSPPYWGLRDYGTATWAGGDAACDHVQSRSLKRDSNGGLPPAGQGTRGTQSSTASSVLPYRDRCGKCGAVRQDRQLGLERTPEDYVAGMVAVFREVRRVLRPDGTLWLNLGSSFAAGGSGPSRSRPPERAPACGTDGTGQRDCPEPGCACLGLCDGCRDALSPRTTGTLRPLPGAASQLSPTARDTEPVGSGRASADASPPAAPVSTTTRSGTPPRASCSHCGNCGACLSVLRSSSRDARECGRSSWLNYTPFKPKDLVPIPWLVALALQADGWYLRRDVIWSKPNPMPESVTDRPSSSHEYVFLLSRSPRYFYDADAVREDALHAGRVVKASDPDTANGQKGQYGATALGFTQHDTVVGTARNRRSVWTIATQPYPGAHFAVFPEALVEPCVLAGTSERGCCPDCGAPWERVVERGNSEHHHRAGCGHIDIGSGDFYDGGKYGGFTATHRDTGEWRPACAHDADPAPCVVLDPFAGSGTVARVANRLSRRAVLIDLNPDYLRQQLERNRDLPLGLTA